MQKNGTFCTGDLFRKISTSKTLVFMARTSSFILMAMICAMQIVAATPGYGQGNEKKLISLDYTNAPIEKVFSAIEKKAEVIIMYEKTAAIKSGKVNISVTNKPVAEVMDMLLKDLSMQWSIREKFIRIKNIENPSSAFDLILSSPSAVDTLITVTGKVTDAAGNVIPGATVMLKGSSQGTATDFNGNFTMAMVKRGSTLQVSVVGYQTQSIPVNGNALIVKLQLDVKALDESVVIAYGTTTKRFNVGSVATVSAAEIEKHPVTNVLLALQGQVPGLLITPTSGAPGAAVNVQIRGQNTLYNGNDNIRPYDQPLFIVDGVPMASQNSNINLLAGFSNMGFTFSTGLSPFSTLNPADIESVTVLKDADATSIYGSQGSNGVILITTKKGKAGKPQLSISARTGVDVATRLVKMMNTEQYRTMRMEAFANDGITTVQGTDATALNYAPDLTIFDQNKNTDWFNYLMGSTATNNNIHGSFSGGSNTTTFIVSGGLTRQGYNFPGGLSNNVYTFHSGFTYTSPNGRLNLGVISDYAYQDNQASAAAALVRNILTPPNYPDLIDVEGKLIWSYKGVSLEQYQTYGALKKVGRTQSSNMNNSIALSYAIIRGLNVNLNIGYNRNNSSEIQQNPLSSQSPDFAISSSAFGQNNFQTLNVEPQLNYKNRFGKGELSVLVGGTYKKNLNDNSQITGLNYTNDALLGSIAGAATVTISDGGNIYKYAGAFGRIGYILDRKYIVSLTGRRDGSSNFGPGKKFGNFGSAGIGWIFSEEQPLKKALPFLSFGKISASYGSTGTDAVAPYRYQTFWQAAFEPNLFQGAQAYLPANIYNPNYSWDVKKTLNTSLDLGFLNDNILLNVTWYRSRCGNQLINARLPYQTGSLSVIENSPATVQNSGLEFTMSTTNIKTSNFKWTTSFNISGNRNILLKFPDLANSAYATAYEIGKSINTSLVYRYKGVNLQTGIFEFYNKKGEVTSTPPVADKELLIDLTPEFFGGLGNVLTYKNLSLSFLFQFSKGTTTNWLATLYNQSIVPGQMMNLPVAALSRWQKPGDVSELQKFTTNSFALFDTPTRNFINSTGAYTESSYARLKMLSLSFSLPERYLKILSLKGLQFYANAENLFVITGYKVGDPENAGGLFTIPLQRTIVGGLTLNF